MAWMGWVGEGVVGRTAGWSTGCAIQSSSHGQVQFFKLMDDIADIYFMGINGSFIGGTTCRLSLTMLSKKTASLPLAYPAFGASASGNSNPSSPKLGVFSTVIANFARSPPHGSMTSCDYFGSEIR